MAIGEILHLLRKMHGAGNDLSDDILPRACVTQEQFDCLNAELEQPEKRCKMVNYFLLLNLLLLVYNFFFSLSQT